MQNIKPLGNRVLVKRSKAPASKGNILLPESAQGKPKEGTVISVGPGKLDDDGKIVPMNVKAGDIVLFTNYAGTEVKSSDDEDYLIMTEEDLLGILAK